MKKCKGFTLIELLVVISITTLLAAILVPTLQRIRRQARVIVCQSNLGQWGIELETFAVSNDNDFTQQSEDFPLKDLVFPQLTKTPDIGDFNEMILCPSAMKPIIRSDTLSSFGKKHHAWREAEYLNEPVGSLTGSYGVNTVFYLTCFNPNKVVFEKLIGTNYGTVTNIPILFDCTWRFGGLTMCDDAPPEYDDMPDDRYFETATVCMDRHNGGINALFRDWSCRKVGLKELWTLKWNHLYDTAGPWTKAGGVMPEDWPEWMRKFKDY
ncbi:MAG: type II secretion system protein [Planctomycetota bacterium]|jgi:prepilin-type N-terminal cleavage/methylation domain-containing protein